jgi:DNA-binding NarL/FixJ family response regulator
VYLTSHADRLTLERAIKTIPAGYIVKPFDEKDLLVNLEIALHNHAQQHNAAYPSLSLKAINKHLVKALSEREFEILNAIYDGKTNQQMAESFYLSVNTIKTHIANIYSKLEVTSRTAAIAKLRNWI